MISNKADLKQYLKIERETHFKKELTNLIAPPENWLFLKSLRRFEYHYNSKGPFHKFMAFIAYLRYRRQALRTGLSIPKNTCQEGLTLYHCGSIVVNAACRIGRNCCIMNNVNIGANGGSSAAPKIGNDVYIGPGAVIFGDIEIADGCYIGANAVVNKSITEPNSVVGGIPAKILKSEPTHWWMRNRLDRS